MLRVIPLTGSHKRQGFDCGRPAQICAYYALTLTDVDTAALSMQRRKQLPRMIPGVRLGRLAVDRRYQGKGLGELLLMDALERVRHITEHAGVVGLFVDALDDQAAQFYTRYGFEAFVDEPLKLFMPVTKPKGA